MGALSHTQKKVVRDKENEPGRGKPEEFQKNGSIERMRIGGEVSFNI